MIKKLVPFIVITALLSFSAQAQNHDAHKPTDAHSPAAPAAPHAGHDHAAHPADAGHAAHDPATHAEQGAAHAGGHHDGGGKYDPTPSIMNHIGNANEFHLFSKYSIPLPCIVYEKDGGVRTFMSSVFHGEKAHYSVAHDRYVSDHGVTKRIIDASFPMGTVQLEAAHGDHYVEHEGDNTFVQYKGKKYAIEQASSFIAATSFYDFSLSKNVVSMIIAGFLLLFLFSKAASGYKTGKAPSGVQNLLEPLVTFIRDEVSIPMIGAKKHERFFPYLLTIFFFILMNNLMGLVPLAPFGANVTGNIATTAALALIAFLVTNLNGNKSYWGHIFWMPGVPVPMKLFLLPIELIGVFTKPISLMIRLFANITAGHIIILALVSLIFVFGEAGKNLVGGTVGAVVAVPFTLFLSVIEIIVAFIQAFIFTILTASYIGAATEEHHHEAHH